MHQAARLQFGRTMDEFARWRAVPEDERSPAPGWWWGTAMAALDGRETMPHEWCSQLGLHDGSGLGDGARVILDLFAEQTALPWPDDFPRMRDNMDHEVHDLHPLPSDDSAFQP